MRFRLMLKPDNIKAVCSFTNLSKPNSTMFMDHSGLSILIALQ